LKTLFDDAAKGEFDVLICTDLTRLTRRLSPEIMTALRDARVRVMTVDGGEIGMADLVAQAIMSRSAKTYSEWMDQAGEAGCH
jgi:DNA invertase Pin-like site-specific DNA recombinase